MRTLPKLAVTIAVILAALLIAACGGDDDEGGDEPTAETPASEVAATAEEEDQCQEVDEPKAKDDELDRPNNLKGRSGSAVFATSCGTFTIRLDAERAPKTSASFAHLVEKGFYDNTSFHRVAPSFVIQGGDPLGDGTGGPGYFIDERPPRDLIYTRGTVAMAKSAAEPPGRSGSQFFVVTAPADAGLPPDYALVGVVSDGIETVERIEALGTVGEDGAPSMPVVIEKATFEPAG